MTKADIRRVAQRFLLTDKKVIVVVGDRASNETPLGKLAPVELRDLDGNLVTAPKPGATTGAKTGAKTGATTGTTTGATAGKPSAGGSGAGGD